MKQYDTASMTHGVNLGGFPTTDGRPGHLGLDYQHYKFREAKPLGTFQASGRYVSVLANYFLVLRAC